MDRQQPAPIVDDTDNNSSIDPEARQVLMEMVDRVVDEESDENNNPNNTTADSQQEAAAIRQLVSEMVDRVVDLDANNNPQQQQQLPDLPVPADEQQQQPTETDTMDIEYEWSAQASPSVWSPTHWGSNQTAVHAKWGMDRQVPDDDDDYGRHMLEERARYVRLGRRRRSASPLIVDAAAEAAAAAPRPLRRLRAGSDPVNPELRKRHKYFKQPQQQAPVADIPDPAAAAAAYQLQQQQLPPELQGQPPPLPPIPDVPLGRITWMSPLYGQPWPPRQHQDGQGYHPVMGELFMHYPHSDDRLLSPANLQQLRQRLADSGLLFSPNVLGQGIQGQVILGIFGEKIRLLTQWERHYLGTGPLYQQPFAAKIVHLDPRADNLYTWDRTHVYLEKEIMKLMASRQPRPHPNIVHYRLAVNMGPRVRIVSQFGEHFYSYQYTMLIMDYANRGNLMHFYLTPQYTAPVCVKFIQDILQAIDYLHRSVGVAHRDIKIDNVVLSDREVSQHPRIQLVAKLCDFGMAEIKWLPPYRYILDDVFRGYLTGDRQRTGKLLEQMVHRADPNRTSHLQGIVFFRNYAQQLADNQVPVDMDQLYEQQQHIINGFL
ncbi:uncharacterized protein LOC128956867 [Oppia nitens]|uniref:uncharacterized protein LOC128956867 n=1 Tax=Oppia nitens TaxID=1686743 RepID=UPI0023DB11E4|nr:uncharacterized protein LOC128956867 [Oppia nitens]